MSWSHALIDLKLCSATRSSDVNDYIGRDLHVGFAARDAHQFSPSWFSFAFCFGILLLVQPSNCPLPT